MKNIFRWVSQKIGLLINSRFFLFCLGLIIGATGLFCTIQGREFYSEYLGFKGDGVAVAAAAYVSPQGNPGSLASGMREGSDSPALEEIVSKVYQLESSSGRNGTDQGCHAKGLHNGYGYAPGSCYESDEATAEIVKDWFARKLEKGLTLDAALCMYNLGENVNHCEYSEMFYSI